MGRLLLAIWQFLMARRSREYTRTPFRMTDRIQQECDIWNMAIRIREFRLTGSWDHDSIGRPFSDNWGGKHLEIVPVILAFRLQMLHAEWRLKMLEEKIQRLNPKLFQHVVIKGIEEGLERRENRRLGVGIAIEAM